MRKIYLIGMAFAYLLAACHQNTSTHNHSDEKEPAHAAEHVHEHGEHDHSAHDHSEHDHSAHNHGHDGHDHAAAEAETHPGEIVFPEAKAAAAGLQTLTVTPGAFTQVVKTGGRIIAAQGDEQTMVATVAGVVTFNQTPFTEGSAVRKGQPVLSLVSGNLAEGDVTVRTRAAFERASSEYERAKGLVKDQIISQKEFIELKTAYETAKAANDAIGGTASGKGVSVAAPINGYLKNLQVKEGDYVSVGQTLASVSQNNRLVLRAEVSEKYYGSLPLVRSANFRTPYDGKLYKLSDLNGRLLSYAKSSDDNSFYIPVSFEFDNKGSLLSGAYVDVWLLTAPIPNTIHIPLSSLIEEQGIYSVFLRLDETCYRKQLVHTGANNGTEVQILSGLKAGDVVVTEGAYHLKLATASNAMPAHTHTH